MSIRFTLNVDDKTGIAWVEDNSTGLGHSCHPNIDASGSIRGMKSRGYWGKRDKVVKSHGYYYNISRIAVDDDLDKISRKYCKCPTCIGS